MSIISGLDYIQFYMMVEKDTRIVREEIYVKDTWIENKGR